MILLRIVDIKYLKFYKRTSYIFYPVLLTILVVLFNNHIAINKQDWAVALDISDLFHLTYYIMIALSVIIQILLNTQYLKLFKLKKNNV